MFPNETKYYIDYGGEMLTVREFSERFGKSPSTIRARLQRGITDWRDLVAPPLRGAGRPVECAAVSDVPDYSVSEMFELYKGFAGSENEVGMIADFACISKEDARDVLKMFRKKLYKGEGK